jgi:biopolymer transport protein ExbB/TolQ
MTTTSTTAETPFRLADVLRGLSASLETPVIAILILIAACTAVLVGWTVAEYFIERKKMTARLPRLLEDLRAGTDRAADIIARSGLLKRQRDALSELLAHPAFTPTMRGALAVRLMEEEQSRYDRILRISELIARLGPMFGLLGTLIPLGPGIIALGQGDTFTLSNSLLTAFDTTVAGLISAAVATVISTARRAWYKDYMSALETVAECLLEQENVKCAEH